MPPVRAPFFQAPQRHLAAFLLASLTALAQPAQAQDKPAIEQQFQRWLTQTIWPRAKAKGVTRATFDSAFQGVTLNWSLPDLVPPGSKAGPARDQHQAEFGTPSAYFAPAGLRATTATGREMAKKHAQSLAAASRKHGVPPQILLAIWGRESGFGRAKIPHNAFEVLGTKGFMSTRATYFADELIAALQISQARHAPPGAMTSSWAGALGQPQFMPSNFLKYAADGDGDGHADIWRSEADTLASIAQYLAQHGWQNGRDWGFEVAVPEAVSCALEGPDQGRKLADWQAMGLTRISGKAFPANENGKDLFLLMPAGRYGPAFLVTPNFYVLKAYNMSDLYALFIGHVSDRIAYGSGDFITAWGALGSLTRGDIARMQRALEAQGHDVGGADGLPGYKTRRSIGRWQDAQSQPSTCFPTSPLKATLR